MMSDDGCHKNDDWQGWTALIVSVCGHFPGHREGADRNGAHCAFKGLHTDKECFPQCEKWSLYHTAISSQFQNDGCHKNDDWQGWTALIVSVCGHFPGHREGADRNGAHCAFKGLHTDKECFPQCEKWSLYHTAISSQFQNDGCHKNDDWQGWTALIVSVCGHFPGHREGADRNGAHCAFKGLHTDKECFPQCEKWSLYHTAISSQFQSMSNVSCRSHFFGW
ncbi:uncharacterized protein [Salminus brasiliensis]|uniref:uncharacterized protein isoform X2 n=1 Tax=Salminus brasiliensis TaxID=930266 RepID=UPI003B836995